MNTISMMHQSFDTGIDGGSHFVWSRLIDPRVSQRSELLLDLLNFTDLRRELSEGLERQRKERQREAGFLELLEERFRRAAEARDVCRMDMNRYVVEGAVDDEHLRRMQGTLGRLSAEASLNLLELNTYRNRIHQLADRIKLIEDRLDVIDAEMAARRRRLEVIDIEIDTTGMPEGSGQNAVA